MKRIEYKAGQVISGLVFLEEVDPYRHPSRDTRKARFRCYCGNEFEAIISHIKNSNTTSCGCYFTKKLMERNKTHGLTKHSLYNVWARAKSRCYDMGGKDYKNYGGRGIVMCDEWLNDFKPFYDWAMVNGYAVGLQIDRENNDGDYEPSNCRFVTQATNCQNKRNNKLNWVLVKEIRGIKLSVPETTLADLALTYSVSAQTISSIIKNKIWKEK